MASIQNDFAILLKEVIKEIAFSDKRNIDFGVIRMAFDGIDPMYKYDKTTKTISRIEEYNNDNLDDIMKRADAYKEYKNFGKLFEDEFKATEILAKDFSYEEMAKGQYEDLFSILRMYDLDRELVYFNGCISEEHCKLPPA